MRTNNPYVRFDKDYLRENIPIESVIAMYIDGEISTRKNIRCPDPAHTDKMPSAKIYTNTNTCYCHACGKSMDVFSILEMYNKGLSFPELCYLAAEKFGIPLSQCSNYDEVMTAQKEKRPVFAEKFPVSYQDLKSLGLNTSEDKEAEPQKSYLKYFQQMKQNINMTTYHRGLSPATLEHFNVGFDPHFENPKSKFDKSNGLPRLIIPTSEHSFQARLAVSLPDKELEKQYKCRKVGNAELFNAEALNHDRPVFIVEGEIDAMSFYEIGSAAIGIGGVSNVHNLIERFAKDKPHQALIISMDNDEKGTEAKLKLIEGFDRLGITYIVADVAAPYKDANEALTSDRSGFAEMVNVTEIYAARLKSKERLIPQNVRKALDDIEVPEYEHLSTQPKESLKTVWYEGDTETKISVENFILERVDALIGQYAALNEECTKSCREIAAKYPPDELLQNIEFSEKYNKEIENNPKHIQSMNPDLLRKIKDAISFKWSENFGSIASERLSYLTTIKEQVQSYQKSRDDFIKTYGSIDRGKSK